jgi:hypothetical protein
MLRAVSSAMPLRRIPSISRSQISAIRSRLRLCPIARRRLSASPGEKPAQAIATCIPCSWNSGTPNVRFRIGSSAGWG